MARVFWDTNLFIYLLEDHPEFGRRVADLRRATIARRDQLFTSALTVGEILVKPASAGPDQVSRYLQFFRNPRLTVLTFDIGCAPAYAEIRQDRSIRLADAIQLAVAAGAEIDLFITSDERLSRKIVPGIQFITSLARAPI